MDCAKVSNFALPIPIERKAAIGIPATSYLFLLDSRSPKSKLVLRARNQS